MEHSQKNLDHIQINLGYRFRNIKLLKQALTHSSYANERGVESYERLECLGDAGLSFYIINKLFDIFPNATEGEISIKKEALINGTTQTEVLNRILNLPSFINHSVGTEREKAFEKMKGQVLEAIIGAVYKDGGLPAMHSVIETLYAEEFRNIQRTTQESKIDYPSHQFVPEPTVATQTHSVPKKESRKKLGELAVENGLAIKYKKDKDSNLVKIMLIRYEGMKGSKQKRVVFEATALDKTLAATKALEFLLSRIKPQAMSSRSR
jgi:ribonuclease-3